MARRKSRDGKKAKEDKNAAVDKNAKTEEEEEKLEPVSYFALYRYADAFDWVLVIVGSLCALAHGALSPAFVVFFGDVIDSFGADADPADLIDSVAQTSLYILYLACGAAVTSYFQVACFTLSAQRQSLRIRKLYFKALVRQEMAWYDQHKTGALSSRISSDVPQIQEALGDKVGSFLQFLGMFLAGFIVGFIYGWKMTLVIIGMAPLIGIGGALMSKYIEQASSGGQGFYATAGSVADEVIRMIRTVIAFDTQDREVERYHKELDGARKAGEHGGLIQGCGMGFTFFMIFISYSVTFWFGSYLVDEGELTAGEVIIVFFSVIIGAMSLGQAAPNIKVMAAGRGAARAIFDVIDRPSEIDSLSEEGAVPSKLTGHIRFKDVDFTYPTRPDEQILHKLNIEVKPQETVALVGASGCGKSTTVAMLERFYDPTAGSIELDGTDIRKLNIQWLRSQIGLVSQTPVLFPTTIADNIALGKDDATEHEVHSAARMANAHDFIMALPDGYNTMVGDSGTQLSGGQRQRIAIARALIKAPNILLLDEATSALDNESEAIVKEALDRASTGRTTIMIAHRLSTVFSADKIVVIDHGRVVEAGSPQELLDQQGAFYRMVQAQHGHGGENSPHGRMSIDVAGKLNAKVLADSGNVGVSTASSSMQNTKAVEVRLTADMDESVEKAADEVPKVDRSMVGWAFELNKPELKYIVMGCICGAIEGLIWPVYAVLLAEILTVLNTDNNKTRVNQYASGFIGIAVLATVVLIGKLYFLSVAGERLTMRLRDMVFRVMVSKSAGWYDDPRHSRGILTTRLSSDASAVRGTLGDRLGLFVQILFTILGCITVACIYCWRVGLVILAAFPVVALGGAVQFKMISGFSTGKAFERSGKFASIAVEEVRTVAFPCFVQDYYATLEYPSSVMKKTAQIQGLTFAFSEFCVFAVWALAFWYGSEVVDDGFCGFNEMFTAQMSIVFMGIIAGQAGSLAPDAVKAKQAASRLYAMIQMHKEEQDAEAEKTYVRPQITGRVEFKDVDFVYPTRPDAQVLSKLNLSVEPGKTIALVGQSGCGKSTMISLIERFYSPVGGKILVDGVDAEKIDPGHLRKHIALVTQQPELFASSIKENIAYGIPEDVPMERIEDAARKANAYDFIQEFQDKFDTLVGEKGAQLSGGQRQRIAVARALIRADDIKILLLDEASAALDTKSEKLVHEALDRARKGRTTFIVAHRLSTIKNADEIAVIKDGRVVEKGSHKELMAKKQHYYELVSSQEFVTYEEDDETSGSNTPSPANTDHNDDDNNEHDDDDNDNDGGATGEHLPAPGDDHGDDDDGDDNGDGGMHTNGGVAPRQSSTVSLTLAGDGGARKDSSTDPDESVQTIVI
ncbi:multidrug resistance protein [Salpingoeca rosetta]|uniref:Multidrug resistance protein n=1 Tax=Salpingoeca rosetta (strain ATCC 50818 / BSB-021) TaxID=946362 RepID=F2TX93_SALR5|nr:multidrug resistance protein [Salpingoeca rosetta]EGD76002.1 multidrug resistance protein [Salpingoeca rosetta]|eukprot:XP_004998177.1 multidrug resistance protein [Salpingoeca rosetta]